MAVGCGFITCAKKKEIEFCWDCEEDTTCSRWRHHREFSKQYDTFKCYRKLGDNISFVLKNGIEEFEKQQKAREKLLEKMLKGFNEGRSKNILFCCSNSPENRRTGKSNNRRHEKIKR